MTSQYKNAHRSGKSKKKVSKGFTLVELMVALVLGFILIAGVLNIFNSNRENFRVTENLARIQENSRVAFDLSLIHI